MAFTLHRFDSNGELCDELATRIAENLADALAARGQATLAVSGGSTPVPLFQALSGANLDWSRVTVTLVDERWVDPDHPDSNARLVREHLLQGAAAAATFVPMKTPGFDPFSAEDEVAEALSAFAGHIDVVVLGMGGDGHTASFFPGAKTLAAALDRESRQICVAVEPPAAPHARMTLTLAALDRARHTYLHITGPDKLAVLQQADGEGAVEALPIRAMLRRDPPLDVYYAAGKSQ
jgi:6-phosphogluconolactonase